MRRKAIIQIFFGVPYRNSRAKKKGSRRHLAELPLGEELCCPLMLCELSLQVALVAVKNS